MSAVALPRSRIGDDGGPYQGANGTKTASKRTRMDPKRGSDGGDFHRSTASSVSRKSASCFGFLRVKWSKKRPSVVSFANDPVLQHQLNWRKSRDLRNGSILLRSLLREPDVVDGVKYKDESIDWIHNHYLRGLSSRKGEYLLEKELMFEIVRKFHPFGWRTIMYEYHLYRWDGDLILVRDEASDNPVVLVVEAKVLTGVKYDQEKLEKVIQQADLYGELARGLFHGKCTVRSIAIVGIAVDGVGQFEDSLYVPPETLVEDEYLLTMPPLITDWTLLDLQLQGIWPNQNENTEQ